MPKQGFQQVQKQTQSMVLAPQLRQSLKILQVPAMELRSTILEELAANPTLEELPYDDISIEAPEESSKSNEETAPDGDRDGSDEPEPAPASSESSESLDFSDEYEVLNRMGEEWRDALLFGGCQQAPVLL